MKKYKIYLCFIIIFAIYLIYPIKNTFAKYAFTESMLVANIYIDRTKPNVEISYSVDDLEKEKIIVTITVNEEIKEIEGWRLLNDKKTLVKEYEDNIVENIKIEDMAGNKLDKMINIDQISKEQLNI